MRSFPKSPRKECPHLLLMARNYPRPCMLRVCCDGHVQPTVACHGNSHLWNKGGGLKAHDCYTVWGCARCHSWLDSSYSAEGEERAAVFLKALRRQIDAWRDIATDPLAKPKDRDAVQWALTHLIADGWAVPHHLTFAEANDAKFQEAA